MTKIAVNIPLEFTIKDELIEEIQVYNSATFPEIKFGNNNFTSYVKISLENMLSHFNKKHSCDCKNNIQNSIAKHIGEYNSKLQIVGFRHEEEIKIKQEQINAIRKDYEDKIKNIEYKCSLDIQNKEKQLEKIQQTLDEKIQTAFGERERDYVISIERKESQIEMLNYKLENAKIEIEKAVTINKELGEIKESIYKVFRPNNAVLGAVGENFIYDYIKDYTTLTECKVEDVSGNRNACDIAVYYKSIKCGIESKNHINNIKSDSIKRFIEVDIANPNYNCGIFCSIKSEFVHVSNIKHFDIKFYHNKPVVFITEAIRRPEHIIYAIKTLDFIISNNSKSENEINTIIQSVKTMMLTMDKLQRNNNQVIKMMKESNKDIEDVSKNIRKLLGEDNDEETKQKKTHTCERCDKTFNKKVEFNRHVKECKNNIEER